MSSKVCLRTATLVFCVAGVMVVAVKPATLDRAVSLTEYAPMNGGIDLALLYHAVSKEPVDYEELARLGFSDYAHADVFHRRDMLPVLRQKFDATIAALGKRPYIYIRLWDVRLGNYDPDLHAFPIYGFSSSRGHPYKFNDCNYQLRFPNADDFQFYRVSEQEAKAIQSVLGRSPALTARVYGIAQKADPGATVVQIFVTAVGFYETDGNCAGRGQQDCIRIVEFRGDNK